MNRVVHFEIQADDVERAKKFYQNALGWKIEQLMSKEKDGMGYWGVTTGEKEMGINGGLYERPKDDEAFYYYNCTVAVKNLDQAIEAIKKNGGTITKEKMHLKGVGYLAMAKDTEGNNFGLIQPTDWQPK